MFQFSGFPSRLLGMVRLQRTGLPHSDICGSKVITTSPQLFAGSHVFLRLWEPRHPPYTLIYFHILSYLHSSFGLSWMILFPKRDSYHSIFNETWDFVCTSVYSICQRTLIIPECRFGISDFLLRLTYGGHVDFFLLQLRFDLAVVYSSQSRKTFFYLGIWKQLFQKRDANVISFSFLQ